MRAEVLFVHTQVMTPDFTCRNCTFSVSCTPHFLSTGQYIENLLHALGTLLLGCVLVHKNLRWG